MAKTTFGNGVIVTNKWLNGAKQIFFDGQDLDWHFNPLGLESLVLRGPNGLDSRYVTLTTDQPNLTTTGVYISGFPISGSKVFTGKISFGYDPSLNPSIEESKQNAPLSFLTNAQYNWANGIVSPSVVQKYASLQDAHLVTKKILQDQFDILVIDNGTY